MTVSNNTTRQLFACNGVTTARTANFRVIDASQLRVVLYTIATGAAVDLTGSGTDYTVTSAGGATTDFSTTVAYSSAYKVIALLDMPLSQETDYVANDSFPAESHEAALDKLTLITQQAFDILSRCATLPEFAATNLSVVLPTPTDGYGLVWDGATGTIRNTTVSIATLETEAAALYAIAAAITTVASISANVTSVAGNAANINTVAGISAAVSTVSGISGAVSAVSANSANINTVAGISANVTTVAGISASVITVAGISANVTTVAGLSTQVTGVYNIRTDVTTVAGISGNVTTVAGISANVTTVAGISANVTTVAGITANIATVAGISANVTTVAGISTAVSTVATNITDVNTCATNIAAIIAAPAAATAAAASAAAAAAAAAGISMKSSCRVATTAALTVTYANGTLGVGATLTNAGAQAALSLDSVSLSVNDRVLVKDQSSALQNGIYFVTVVGTGATNWVLTRATDYDQAAEIVEGTATIISEGTVNASHIFVMTHTTAITVGTTAIDYTALTANATSANTLTTPRAIYGNNFDGSAALTQVISSVYGGTGNGWTKFSGPTTAEKTKTLRDASDTILELGGSYSPSGTWTSMTFVTPALGTPASGVLSNCTTATQSSGDNSTKLASTAYADAAAKLPFRTTSAATTIIASDKGGVVQLTGSTDRTWDATAVATLGANFSCEIWNDSTAIITFDPNSSEQVDALTTIKMYPGEHRRLTVNAGATAFTTGVIRGFKALFAASGSLTVPPGYTALQFEIWSGGGAGAVRTTTGNASGGSGGAYYPLIVNTSQLVAAGSTETITVGGTAAAVASSNANGTTGNDSAVTINGVTLTIKGGGGGIQVATSTLAYFNFSGYPAIMSAPGTVIQSSGYPYYYNSLGNFASWPQTTTVLGGLIYSGVGGDVSAGNAVVAGGNSIHGGGGGGGSTGTAGGTRTGGTSIFGGAGGTGSSTGGAGVTAGSVPSGGGGAGVGGSASGAGAAGQVIVRGIV